MKVNSGMKRQIFRSVFIGMALACFPLGLGANATEGAQPDVISAVPEKQTIALAKGQLLSLVMPKIDPAGTAERQEYSKRAFTIARSLGLQLEGSFTIPAKIVGNFTPDVALFFSWPNQEAETALSRHPEWPEIKALRPKAWEELKIYTVALEGDTTLEFDTAKSYTLAIAWLNPARPNDYYKYMEAISDDVRAVGGRFVLKMVEPKFEAHASPKVAPGQVTIAEWPSDTSVAELRRREGYAEKYAHFESGVSRFEFYKIAPVIK